MTWLVLAATALCVLVAAMPALFRVAGLGPLFAGGSLGLPSRRPTPAFHPVPGLRGSSGSAELPLDDDDGPSEPGEPGRPRMSTPFDPDPSEPSSPDPDAPNAGDGKPKMRPAVTRKKATLHLSSSEDTQAVGEVDAGTTVFVMREKGAWALVFHTSDDGVVMGWIERSLLSVR